MRSYTTVSFTTDETKEIFRSYFASNNLSTLPEDDKLNIHFNSFDSAIILQWETK